MQKAELDKAVERCVRRCRKAVSAVDVATRLEISTMAAMHSLRRLRDRGHLLSSIELIDTPARLRATVEMYQPTAGSNGWPAWLYPTSLPVVAMRRVVVRGAW